MWNPRSRIKTSFFNTLRSLHSFKLHPVPVGYISATHNFGSKSYAVEASTPENPDSDSIPPLLRSDAEKELLPKIRFFQSKGASGHDIFEILFKSKLIGSSLEEQILPRFNLLSTLLESDSKAIAAIKKKPSVVWRELDEKTLLPKIRFFQSKGASGPDILNILFKFNIIGSSLEEQILPRFNLLSTLLESDSKAIAAIKKKPSVICRKFDEITLLPKIRFFQSKGASPSDIFNILFKSNLIGSRLEEQILPRFNLLSSLLGSDSKAIAAIKKNPSVVWRELDEKTLLPKIRFFQSKGASGPDIFNILFKSKLIGSSLEEQILPRFNLISSLLESDSKAIAAIKKKPSVVRRKFDEKSLLPKIRFFQSKGASGPDIFDILFQSTRVMDISLEECIIPCFNHLSNLFRSDSKAICFIKEDSGRFANMVDNVKFLREDEVPESDTISMFNQNHKVFIHPPITFKNRVKELKKIGIGPSSEKFLHALSAFSKNDMQELNYLAYEHFGFSRSVIREHGVLKRSVGEIAAVWHFLVEEMGLQPSVIVNQPSVFGLDFRKLIVPRGLYAKELLSQGLIEELNLSTLSNSSEKEFVRMFVDRYEDRAPELLKLYKKKR